MKKIILSLIILITSINLHAAAGINRGDGTDTVKINKQIKKINLNMADLQDQLLEVRTRIPVDSVKLESALGKSHAAQVKSKKRSEQAVGGDMDDVKLAEKQAKKAANETSDAEDASKNLESDRKSEKKLVKQIEKAKKELDKLQLPKSE
ncbi:MAG: hypothetical protein JWR50_907 [Mucilaginibacter sp.]|nr:hypothetical protein [Mucilaginibacter sp.]